MESRIERTMQCDDFAVHSNGRIVALEEKGAMIRRFYPVGKFDAFVEFLVQARKQIRKDAKEIKDGK